MVEEEGEREGVLCALRCVIDCTGGQCGKKKRGGKSRGRIRVSILLAHLGHFYPWASPDYVLNKMTLAQVFMYYDSMLEMLDGKDKIIADPETPDFLDVMRVCGKRVKSR